MLCSAEKSNMYSLSNDGEQRSISEMKPMGDGKAKAP